MIQNKHLTEEGIKEIKGLKNEINNPETPYSRF
jgi:hypothetical protein